MTKRLFWNDPDAREFTARVVRRTSTGVVLDQTLFYPTSGGQPHDTGMLNGLRVVDVVEEGEEIVHVLSGALEGLEVKGVVDEERRRDHMQQHDGQHILSQAFERVCEAETTSFHLGAETCTIDLDRENSSSKELDAAEELANAVVWENRPIRIDFFSKEEATRLPMRKVPDVTGRIRIVQIENFDCCACCGTHGKSSGETGMVLVLGAERFKGGTRVSFVCGWRALRYVRESHAVLRTAGARVSASRGDLMGALERIQREAAEGRKALASAEKQLAVYHAKELSAAATSLRGRRFVVEVLGNRDLKYLQGLATGIVAEPGRVALLAGLGETTNVVLARSKDVDIDLRPIGQEVFTLLGGRGGGAPHFVQGGGSGRDAEAALRLAQERVVAKLPP